MKIGFIFPYKPQLSRFEADYCGNYLREPLETTTAVNQLVAKVSSKNLKQVGYQ